MAVDIAAVLTASIDDFKAKMAEADASVKGLSDSGSSNFNKLSSIGKGALLGIAGAGAVVVGASIDLASKFESTTTTIAANADISVAAAQKIGNAFLDTAGSTIYSGQQIATAYSSVAAQLGQTQGHALSAAQAMTVMKAAMDLAEGSGTDLNTATTALASVMQAYGIKARGAAEASDELFSSARLSGNSVSATATAFAQLHTQLGGVTPPLGQVGGLLVDLKEHGEVGSRAIRSVSTAFVTMLKSGTNLTQQQQLLTTATDALPPSLDLLAAAYTKGTLTSAQVTSATKNLTLNQKALWDQFTKTSDAVTTAQQKYNNLGIEVFNAQGKFVGIKNVIEQLGPALAGMSSQQDRLNALQQVFGTSSVKLLDTIEAGPAAYDKATAAVEKSNSAQDAANKQSQTLQHQLDVLKASAEDYGTKLGIALLPKLEELIKDTESAVEWFSKHKDVTEALGIAIGTLVTGAIAVYLVNVGTSMVKATQAAIESLTKLTASLFGSGSAAEVAGTEISTTGTEAEVAGTKFAGAGAAAGEAGMAGGLAEGEAGAAGLTGVLGPLGVAVGVVTLGAVAIGKAIAGATPAFVAQSNVAASMAADTLPQMTLKLADLKAAQEKASKSMQDGGIIGSAAKVAYQQLGNQIDELKNQHTQLTTNLQILGTNFGITKNQAQEVAQTLGINLAQALTRPEVTALGEQLSSMGIQADSAGTHIANLSANSVSALTAIESQLKTTSASQGWAQLGNDIDSGVAAGITSGQQLVGAAAAGMANNALQTAKHSMNISSPSRRAADELGLPFVQGIAQGILENAGVVTAASKSIANSMVAAGGTSTPGAIGGIAPLSGLGGSAQTSAASGPLTFQLILNGINVGQAILPSLQTAVLQAQRGQSLPIFGTTQTAAG